MSFSRTTSSAVGAAALIFAGALLCLPTHFLHGGQARAESSPKTQIKFATLAPEGSAWMKVMHAIDDEVRAATENRIGFKFYPGGVQGDEKDVLRKIRAGQLHGGGFTGFGLGAIASEFRVIELPFMFRNLDEVDHVRDELDPYFYDVFMEKGYRFLGWGDVGFVYIFSKSPITTPEELRQAKMWTWSGDDLAEIFFKAFDVSPIPLALPDVLTSLQMGIVNAVYSPPLACVALQWFTRVDYMTDVPITYGFGALLVSEKSLEDADPVDIETLRQICSKHSRLLIDKTRVQNNEAIVSMESEGVKVVPVDPEVMNVFFTTGRSAWQDGVGRLYPEDLLQRVKRMVDEYRATTEETATSP
jgi:TRAP-type C4-dicarboxylate transport system substrate-binding protein